MRTRRKVYYNVFAYASIWWVHGIRRWVHTGKDEESVTRGHMVSSHLRCTTKKTALRHLDHLLTMTDAEVGYERVQRKWGRWVAQDFVIPEREAGTCKRLG